MGEELVYMQYNINDSKAVFLYFVLIILRMANLDTSPLCFLGRQAWVCP